MSIPSLPARLRSLLRKRKRSRSRWPARLRFYVPAFLLALLLVGAQQAALLHAFEHDVARAAGSVAAAQAAAQTASPSSDTREHEQGAPGGSYCDKCFQFAHLTGAGFAAASAVLDLTASTEAARSRGAPERAVRAPASRSRGPPIAL